MSAIDNVSRIRRADDVTVSVYDKFVNKVGEITLKDFIMGVRTGKSYVPVNEIRTAILSGKQQIADGIKKSLRAITPSAVVNGDRKAENVREHSGIIHLDFDDLNKERAAALALKVKELPYTAGCFVSPSGNGLKVFVLTDVAIEDHEVKYKAVQKYYERETQCLADSKCKDITRLCFDSWDPDAFWNSDALMLTMDHMNKHLSANFEPPTPRLEEVRRFTDQHQQYEPGNRNNYVYVFACNARRAGIEKRFTEAYCVGAFADIASEIPRTVYSAYSKPDVDFAKFANFVPDGVEEKEAVHEALEKAPLIPDFIFANLPRLLRDGTDAFTDRRQKDLFLSAAIVILTGCLPNVNGVYRRRNVYPNLYMLGIAPPGAGKEAMVCAKEMTDKYHEYVLSTSQQEAEAYKRIAAECREKGNVPPRRPKFRVVQIPLDVSHAKVVQHIADNGGGGIFFDSEIDTAVTASKKEWGMPSELLRKGFHAEKLSLSRKTGDEFIEVDAPHPTTLMSGTPGQAVRYIVSPENGLMSRFIFYLFNGTAKWDDVSPSAPGVNLSHHFKVIMGERVAAMASFLEQNPTFVDLTESQWQKLNEKFSRYLTELTAFTTEDASGIVKRLGLILYRVCIVLSAIRKFDNQRLDETILCTDEDFDTAQKLIEVYLEHSLIMLALLRKGSRQNFLDDGARKRRFFDALPETFKRNDAIKVGQDVGLGESTVDKLLKKLIGSLLDKGEEYGTYVKRC